MGIELAGRVAANLATDIVAPADAAFSIRFAALPEGGATFDKAYSTFRKQATALAKELGVKLDLSRSSDNMGPGVEGQLSQKRGGTTGLGAALDGMLAIDMPGHHQTTRWGAISDRAIPPYTLGDLGNDPRVPLSGTLHRSPR